MTHVEMAALARKAGFPVLLDHNNQIGTRIYDWLVNFMELSQQIERDKLSAELNNLREIKKAAEMLVNCKGRYHSELNMNVLREAVTGDKLT